MGAEEWPIEQDRLFRLEVGALLRVYRAKRGKTQQETADLAGTSDKSLSLYENGLRAIPFVTWTRLAEALRIPKREWPTHVKPSSAKPSSSQASRGPSKSGRRTGVTASSR